MSQLRQRLDRLPADRRDRFLRMLDGGGGEPATAARPLSPDEQEWLLAVGSGRQRPVPAQSADQWFAAQARATPDAVAVVAGSVQLRYAELDAAANRLAWLLNSRGVGREDLVAVCLPRGHEYAVAVLAVLKAGAAFVPLDPADPPARAAALLADAAPTAVLTAGDPSRWLAAGAGTPPAVLAMDQAAREAADCPGDRPPATPAPDDLAYVLFTSGSTGRPKGVMIEHHSVVNFVAAVRDLFALTAGDRVLGYAAHTFDVSIFEIFAALLTGAQLHVALDADRLDLDRLQKLLAEAGITVVDLPPSVMGLLDPSRLDALRIAFVGGEAFPGKLVTAWNRVSRFFNGYGPTECTVTMITYECTGSWHTSPPIGHPLDNHVAHVVDSELRLVPPGVAGELAIGGAGLARGYLNQPELTRSRFVRDPFGTAPDGRLYLTGDLVRRQPDGALVFLGRVDRQLKVNGVRVEPGEIEAALVALPGVRQAYVDVAGGPTPERRLVAYVGAPGTSPPTGAQLREALVRQLPARLVPQRLVVLPRLPLTSSGKVDARALPEPDLPGVDLANADLANADRAAPEPATPEPATPERPTESAAGTAGARTAGDDPERVIAEEVVGPILQVSEVDTGADFFALGGGSLQAARVISALNRRFQVQVTVAEFMRAPTVAALAALVERQRLAALPEDQLLAVLAEMPEEEVERIMEERAGAGGQDGLSDYPG